MARHIMAVCVVCLLCADRLPCQDHFSGSQVSAYSEELPHLNAKAYSSSGSSRSVELTATPPTNQYPAQHEHSHSPLSSSRGSSTSSSVHHRRKRHAEHTHEDVSLMPGLTKYFLENIVTKFNDKEYASEEKLNKNGFQRLLMQLGLHQYLGSNNNGTCVADSKLVQHMQPHDLNHDDVHQEVADNMTQLMNCTLTMTENETNVPCMFQENYTLNKKDLLNICPVLLYQMASSSEAERAGCIELDVLEKIDIKEQANKEDIFYVWIYAFISVFACGILGLVGVAIIPFMNSRYYKHIIQYLVSLAVGTMTGDALLHLLPHSLANQSEPDMIFKGLTCMGGIIFFYVTEHGLTMISEWRKSIEKKEPKKPSRAKVMRDPDSSVNNSVAGDKMCKQKYSSYPYCYDEIAMDHKQDVWMHLPNDGAAEDTNARNGKTENDGTNDSAAAAQSLLSTSHNHYAEMNHHNQHNHHDHQQSPPPQESPHIHDSNTISTDLDGNAVADELTVNGGHTCVKDNASSKNDTVTVILREHESSHHGHSHRHGHVHSPPESLSAVAWMIIMGDGLHNFTDGMAIGAAFADNIAGGFSTSLAVFCHELPHELGDFAILMKAGMSVKSAVYYNLLTGVLSFIGMIFGIVFGQSHEAAQWMFAAAAGLFIYIALVDMMPEISAAHKSLAQFALQIIGMLSGVFIMFLIAIYEKNLLEAFSSTPAAGHHQHVH